MDDLQVKKAMISLVESGVDYFTIAKAFDLKYQNDDESDILGAIDVGILPSDPIVIDRAKHLLSAGMAIEIIHEVTGIPINVLENLEQSIIQIEHVDVQLIQRLMALDKKYYRYIDCLRTKSKNMNECSRYI